LAQLYLLPQLSILGLALLRALYLLLYRSVIEPETWYLELCGLFLGEGRVDASGDVENEKTNLFYVF
jgi:hypothetical protein